MSKADELFFVVDEHDRPLPPLPRNQVHGHPVWHRVSHIWLVNNRGDILCQQRALTKELNPGFWEPFFGGHLAPDELYEQAARRELKEELGLQATDLRHWQTYKFHHPSGCNDEFQAVFIMRWNGQPTDVHFSDGEVAQVAWLPAAAVQKSVGTKHDWTNCGYEQALLKDLADGKV